ncbi:MAG: biopolymer transporter ExbD [Calditrichaeota bacterium]|nr:MAG: biopolymer transporter ExbD [Calditrichota bacterium]
MAAKTASASLERGATKRRNFSKNKSEPGLPPLTSMMDAMTIILLFLLKSFSTEGSIVSASKDLQLAISDTDIKAERSMSLSISRNAILIDDKPVVLMSEVHSSDQLMIDKLYTFLEKQAELQKKVEQSTGRPFKGEVTIQVDKDVNYDSLLKVLFTSAQAEYSRQRLLVIRNE